MIQKTDKLTSSVKRLLIEFMAKRQIDRARKTASHGEFGLVGSIAAALVEDDGATLKGDAQGAFDDVNAALLAVRSAAAPNPFKDYSDEDIAAHILTQIEKRRTANAHP